MTENNVIIFDGVCNLCNWTVRFIIKRDPQAVFKFTAAQSTFGEATLKRNGYSFENPESILLFKDGEILSKSSAAMAIAAELSGLWKFLSVFRFVPKKLRDNIYDWVARNRYGWFGKIQIKKI